MMMISKMINKMINKIVKNKVMNRMIKIKIINRTINLNLKHIKDSNLCMFTKYKKIDEFIYRNMFLIVY